MRDYAKVSPRFWIGATGKAIRKLGIETQLVALYVMTCPSSNMTGIYYLPIPTLAHETGLTLEGASKALRSLGEIGFAYYDDEIETVWVPEMASHQIGARLVPKDRRHAGVLNELERHKCRFINDFYDRYREAYCLPERSPFEAPSKPLRSQEQEQDQDQDQEQEQEHAHEHERDPTPSGVQQRQQRQESHSGSRLAIARPQRDAQAVLEPEAPNPPSGLENVSDGQPSEIEERSPTGPIARPRNLNEALRLSARERAQVLVDEEHLESWLEPHRWPEVVELGERFATALGWTRPRMTRASDARRLVHLLAAFDAAELDRAVESAPDDDWLTTGRKGLGSLSVEVVSRLLAPKRVAKARRAPPIADEDPERLESGLRGLALLYGKPYPEVGT